MARVTILASRPTIRVVKVREDDRAAEARNHNPTKITPLLHKSNHRLFRREHRQRIKVIHLLKCQTNHQIGVSSARRIILSRRLRQAVHKILPNRMDKNRAKVTTPLLLAANNSRKNEVETGSMMAIG